MQKYILSIIISINIIIDENNINKRTVLFCSVLFSLPRGTSCNLQLYLVTIYITKEGKIKMINMLVDQSKYGTNNLIVWKYRSVIIASTIWSWSIIIIISFCSVLFCSVQFTWGYFIWLADITGYHIYMEKNGHNKND